MAFLHIIAVGSPLKSSERVKNKIITLIDKGRRLDPADLESFNRWAQNSYEALEFNPSQQQRFEKYCRMSCDSLKMRLFIGVWILSLSLDALM